MTQNVNQFALSNEKGTLDLRVNSNIIQARVHTGVTLIAGQAVKLVDTAGGIPVVTEAADTDAVFGYVVYSHKETDYVAGQSVEIGLSGTTMRMIAGEALAPFVNVMHVLATGKVITAAGTTKCISAVTLDKASGDGSLIRCVISAFPTVTRPSA